MTDFQTFWASYPRKVGRLAAEKAYEKARKMATADEILAGVGRYRLHKPAYADWCHPRTWLSQGRWLDQYDEPPVTRPFTAAEITDAKKIRAGWFGRCKHDPICADGRVCEARIIREARVQRGDVA